MALSLFKIAAGLIRTIGSLKLAKADVDGLGTADSPTFAAATLSGLTSGRVVYVTTSGLLTDSSALTFNGSALSINYQIGATGTGDAGGNGVGFTLANSYGGATVQWNVTVDNAYSKGLNFIEVGVANARLFVAPGGNVGMSTATFGTSAAVVFAMATGTAPASSVENQFQMYSADQAAGNACPHFRTENDAIIKLYKETTGVAEAAFVENAGGAVVNVDSTFGGYTLQQVVKALQNQGLLT